MKWRRYSVPIAIFLGPIMLMAMVARNLGGWVIAPYWIDDLVAGFAVVAASVYFQKDQSSLRSRILSAAFALALAVSWGSTFEGMAGLYPAPEIVGIQTENLDSEQAKSDPMPTIGLVMTLAALSLSIIGLVASLPSKREPLLGTRYPDPPREPALRVTGEQAGRRPRKSASRKSA